MRLTASVVLCALLLGLGCTSKEERLGGYLERAQAYFEQEQWSEAKIEFLNVLQLDPDNAEAHFKMARILWELKQYGDALWEYKEAARLAPDHTEYRLRLAEVLFLARDYDAVQENVDALLEADARNLDALMLRAKVAGVRGRDEKQLEALDQVLAVEPKHAGALAMKAQALARTGDDPGAEAVLRILLEADPGAASHLLYGAFLASREQPDRALQQLRAAVGAAEAGAERSRARLILTNFHLNRGEYEAAEKQLREAREDSPDDTDILLTLAQFYALRGRPQEAEAMLEERVSKLPEEETPLLVLADFYRRTGDREKALATVERALALKPRSERARLRRAEYLLVVNAADVESEGAAEARRLIEEVLQESPNSLLGLFAEAKLLMSEKKFKEAATRLRRVIQEQPSANAHVLLGTTYINLGELELARGEFQQALQLDANHYLARSQLAGLYLRMGERTLAAREAKTALERRPGDLKMLLARAQALTGLGQKDGALEALRAIHLPEDANPRLKVAVAALYRVNGELGEARGILEAIPGGSDDPRVIAEMARLDAREGSLQAAIDRVGRALARLPDSVDLYLFRASLYASLRGRDGRLQQPEKAERDYETVLEKDIGRSEAHVGLASLYREMGRPEEALEHYRSAAQIDTTSSDIHLWMGTLLESMKRIDEAKEAYESSIQLNQDQVVAKNNLAWLLADAESPSPEDLDRALELAQEAKEALPRNPSVADTLGWVMFKKNLPSAAISHFRDAIAGYPDKPALRALVRFHLAQTYERNGEPDRAIAEIKRALAEAPSFAERAEAEALLVRLQGP